MKLFRLGLIAALLAAGFAFFPSHEIASAQCVGGSGGGAVDVRWGPMGIPAGTTISGTMTTDPGSGTAFLVFADGMLVYMSVVYTTPHTFSFTFPESVVNVLIILDWEHNSLASNTYTLSSEGCGAGNDMVTLPSQAVVGRFVTNTAIMQTPGVVLQPEVVMEIGKTLWVVGVDESGMYYKVVLSGEFFWVPVSSMGPNYDEVWNGTPLPTTVVE